MSEQAELQAGLELDALIAEKVMGRIVQMGEDGGYRELNHDIFTDIEDPLTPFSTDPVAALAVVERLSGRGWDVVLRAPTCTQPRWVVTARVFAAPIYERAEADTLPLAVCRAALRAMEQQP